MSYGFIYCMTNPSMPGLCKLGMTERSVWHRRDELSAGTSVPTEFEIEFYFEVCMPRLAEELVHKQFERCRINPGREFFKCDSLEILAWLKNDQQFNEEHYLHEHILPDLLIRKKAADKKAVLMAVEVRP